MLLSDVKLSILEDKGARQPAPASSLFGFSDMDAVTWKIDEVRKAEPLSVLMCLLRTDAFLVPIGDVLRSVAFQSCINQS